jgi:hypothetical protein
LLSAAEAVVHMEPAGTVVVVVNAAAGISGHSADKSGHSKTLDDNCNCYHGGTLHEKLMAR